MDDATKQKIESYIKDNRVMLFMKGTPTFPQCGFSGQVVAILKHHGAQFGACNVLEDMNIRQGIKEFANWPTIPQLYVEGQFIGGCDIVTEMHQNGELKSLLEGAESGS
ncbi:MAG: Grx4 family monothiol glutaredoxin [Planctomycetes bacterium]|nr:Grx4 family monothiol glutaredoxin [Planctomycetota bacterium]